jgi:glucose-6-phosphate 1-dehydrogenase
MPMDDVDALVIFGATGDLAKIETFPALVGLVERGVRTVPVVGVARSGWSLEQFRGYALASLKLSDIDPARRAACAGRRGACPAVPEGHLAAGGGRLTAA